MSLTQELVARCERPEPDPGPNPRFTVITPDELDALTTRLPSTWTLKPLILKTTPITPSKEDPDTPRIAVVFRPVG